MTSKHCRTLVGVFAVAKITQFVGVKTQRLTIAQPLGHRAVIAGSVCKRLRRKLSAPFAKSNLEVRSPTDAADQMLNVIDNLEPRHSGGFFDHRGDAIPW